MSGNKNNSQQTDNLPVAVNALSQKHLRQAKFSLDLYFLRQAEFSLLIFFNNDVPVMKNTQWCSIHSALDTTLVKRLNKSRCKLKGIFITPGKINRTSLLVSS